jgi:ligand-binding sensor domain-containing protein/signal transduction histidine kinase
LRTPLLFVLLLSSILAVGQRARQYSFTRFSTSNGLAANIVTDVEQDKDGFMWMATTNGLQRYDGNSFVTFKNNPTDQKSIPSDHIQMLHLDAQNNLWISSINNKIGIFDTRRFTFTQISVEGKTEEESGYTLKGFLQVDDRLYLYEPSGATFLYDRTKKQFISARKDFPLPPKWRRHGIFREAGTHKYWIAADSGIAVYDALTKNLNYRGNNPDKDPVITAFADMRFVLSIQPGFGRQLFFSMWPPNSGNPFLYVVDKQTGVHRQYNLGQELSLGYHEIGSVFQQRNGRRWVYGKSFLIEVAADGRLINIPNAYINEQSLKFDQINDIFEDQAGNMWISTDNGVFLFNPEAQLFNVYNLLRPDSKAAFEAPVQAIQELDGGTLLVGCWGAGLFHFDRNMNPLPLPAALRPKSEVMSIWDMQRHSRTGKIWLVLQGGGIIVYDPMRSTREDFSPEIFQKRTIRQIEEDRSGNLWFGHQGGRIVKWDFRESRGDVQAAYKLVETSAVTHKIYADQRGNVWVATSGKGLLQIEPNSMRILKTYTAQGKPGERLYNNTPTDVIQYNDSTLLIAAGALNLLNLNTGKVTFFSTVDGLPSNSTQCIQLDDQRNLWIGMQHGLCRINLQKRVVTTYDRRDGITYDNFSTAGAFRLSGGRLAFVTDHNFVMFDPLTLVPGTRPATPVISTFRLAGKTMLVDSLLAEEKVELAHDNTSFIIEFSSLNFIPQYKLQYYYKLEDLNEDWIPASNRHLVHYNYLAPGNYTFKVKAIDADGKESGIREFRIRVTPPFWRSWWFLGSCALAILLLLFYFDRERMKRLRAVQQTRAAIAGNLHDDVHTTLNNINILSEMAKMKADRDIERSKEYIQQISEKSHNMIIAMDDMLWSIDPANDSLEKTRQRTIEFIDALQSRYEAKIDLQVDKKVLALKMDMRMRHEYFLAVKMILRLVVEDAKSKFTQVRVDVVKSKLVLKVKTDQAQLNLKDLTIQQKVENVRKRAANIKAVLDVQVDSTGTSVIMIVPL